MNHTEDVLQASCVSYFNLQYPKSLIYSIHNGGKRRFLTAVRDKKMGLLPGMPDLHIPVKNDSYFGFYLELKSPGEFLKPEQIKRRAFLLAQGYAVVVVWKFEEFDGLVKAYFENRADVIERNIALVDGMIARQIERQAKKRTRIPGKIKRRAVS